MASDTTPQFLLTLLVVSVIIGIGLIVKIQSLQTQLIRVAHDPPDIRQAQDNQSR